MQVWSQYWKHIHLLLQNLTPAVHYWQPEWEAKFRQGGVGGRESRESKSGTPHLILCHKTGSCFCSLSLPQRVFECSPYQCSPNLEIHVDILFSSTRYGDEFCQFHLKLLNQILLSTTHDVHQNYCATIMRSWIVIVIALWCHGGQNLSKALMEIIAAAGIGCEKLEQVCSLFWSQ